MIKNNNKYKLLLEELELKHQSEELKSLSFEFENHDDLFKIFDFAKQQKRFANPNDELEFFLGLKLMSEVMLRNKKIELFTDFLPAFMELMKKIKSK